MSLIFLTSLIFLRMRAKKPFGFLHGRCQEPGHNQRLIAKGNVLENSFRTTLEMTITLFKVAYKQANLKILTIPL